MNQRRVSDATKKKPAGSRRRAWSILSRYELRGPRLGEIMTRTLKNSFKKPADVNPRASDQKKARRNRRGFSPYQRA
jgi:hypothetical protein